MSSSITRQMRALAWNIEFLDVNDNAFAGVFQHGNLLTYGQVWEELQLCFHFPDSQTVSFALWPAKEQAPGYGDLGPIHLDIPADIESPLPGLPTADGNAEDDDRLDRLPLRLYLVRHSHNECQALQNDHLEAHYKNGCLQYIDPPRPRSLPRYLPISQVSCDPEIAAFPMRRRANASKSQSPSKRSSSGIRSASSSPSKDVEEGLSANVVPPCLIVTDDARKTMREFRPNCLQLARTCSITNTGRSWVTSPATGPAVQACHIVPQKQYHLYPLRQHTSLADPIDTDASSLITAWSQTWSSRNGMLLLSHLHEMFDARLFAIHPDTHIIRSFAPYDVLLQYHGKVATFKQRNQPDKKALRHHWDTCVVESMMARVPSGLILSTSMLCTADAGLLEAGRDGWHGDPQKKGISGDGDRGDGSGQPSSQGGQLTGCKRHNTSAESLPSLALSSSSGSDEIIPASTVVFGGDDRGRQKKQKLCTAASLHW